MTATEPTKEILVAVPRIAMSHLAIALAFGLAIGLAFAFAVGSVLGDKEATT